MKYQTGNWEINNPELGAFDLIIGSDVLYERQQPSSIVTPRRLPKLLSSTRIGVTGSVFAGK